MFFTKMIWEVNCDDNTPSKGNAASIVNKINLNHVPKWDEIVMKHINLLKKLESHFMHIGYKTWISPCKSYPKREVK